MSKADSNRPRSSGSFIARGGGWVLAQFGLLLAVLALGLIFPGHRDSALVIPLGGVLMGVGALIALPGFTALKDRLTPFPKPKEHSELVQHGIYSTVRHPLYTSLMLTSLGWVLFRQSWMAALPTVALFVFFDAKARREEFWLSQKFPEYRAYQARVRRFIPWVY